MYSMETVEQYLKAQKLAAMENLSIEGGEEAIKAYEKWLKDEARLLGCDLEIFISKVSNNENLNAIAWELQYAHEAISQWEQVKQLAMIGQATKTISALFK